MAYENFKVALYCPVGDLNRIRDLEQFERDFSFFEKHIHVDKVYLETYRSSEDIDWIKMNQFVNFFRNKGIKTSGGITTTLADRNNFISFCYTNERHKNKLKEIVCKTAELFDEIILDDFYFTNCKCTSCIEVKGDQSWSEYRTALMKHISEEVVIKPAKKINPNVNMIIKYPNWYEYYQETGYNLSEEPALFDMIYTGTETRDSQYTQQHLPRYLSYFIMRYLENVKPDKNGGGWFDPYQCSYNLGSYADQARLTLLGKAKEVTLFCLGSLLHRDYSIFVPIAGHVFDTMDAFLGGLGCPSGTACYIPFHSSGEDYLHNYMGMLGIPFEPYPYYKADANDIFLTQNASFDNKILSKIKASLLEGNNVIITSGLLKVLQDKGFDSLASLRCTDRKATVNRFAVSETGIDFKKVISSDKAILIPQIEYATNDTWQLVSGLGNENNFPILLRAGYGKGNLYVLTIPDDFGDLYYYPREVLNAIRSVLSGNAPVTLNTESGVGLFSYDNETFIIKSFLPYAQEVSITLAYENTSIVDLITGENLETDSCRNKTVSRLPLSPMSYRVFKIKGK